MSKRPEIGDYRGWGARRDSGDAVQELERKRLRKLPRADAERLRRSAGPGVPWCGRSAAEQGAAEQSGGAERRGVAARVGGGASAWDGKLGVRGRFKGGRPEISGSGSGRKAAVVSAGDLGRSVGRALKEEGGSDSGPRWSAAEAGTRASCARGGGAGQACWAGRGLGALREAGPRRGQAVLEGKVRGPSWAEREGRPWGGPCGGVA
jgi:hypothetical protein